MFGYFDAVINMLDYILSDKRRRHLIGGVLLSASGLFGGLAITVMTMKNETETEVIEVDEERE